MPNNINKYDIDEQFTEQAWIDMRARLDEALPVKKPVAITKWLSIAAVVCLFCLGGYWLSLKNTNQTIHTISDKDINHNTNKTEVVSIDEKQIQAPILAEAKQPTTKQSKLIQIDEKAQQAKNNIYLSNEKIDHKKEHLPEQDVVTIKSTSPVKQPILSTKTNVTLSNENQLNNQQKNIANKIVGITKSETNITQAQQNFNLTDQTENAQTEFNNIISKEKPSAIISLSKSKEINQLVTIDQYLQSPIQPLSNILTKNQSNTGGFTNHRFTQKNDDEKLSPKTIQYGIKQGLSSDLTSESAIFAGALIDFNLNNKWFIECAPAYQFGKISRKYEVQYDRMKATDEIEADLPQDYPPSTPDAAPPELTETENPGIIPSQWTKDTLTLSEKLNSHSASIDVLVGYKIIPKIEGLIGFSASRYFYKNQANTSDAEAYLAINDRAGIHSNDFTIIQNKYRLAPKVALRFSLKKALFAEAFFQQNLLPTVSKNYQVQRFNASTNKNDSYLSRHLGVGFLYRFK